MLPDSAVGTFSEHLPDACQYQLQQRNQNHHSGYGNFTALSFEEIIRIPDELQQALRGVRTRKTPHSNMFDSLITGDQDVFFEYDETICGVAATTDIGNYLKKTEQRLPHG